MLPVIAILVQVHRLAEGHPQERLATAAIVLRSEQSEDQTRVIPIMERHPATQVQSKLQVQSELRSAGFQFHLEVR